MVRSIRIPDDLEPWLKTQALEEHRTLANMIVALLQRAREAGAPQKSPRKLSTSTHDAIKEKH